MRTIVDKRLLLLALFLLAGGRMLAQFQSGLTSVETGAISCSLPMPAADTVADTSQGETSVYIRNILRFKINELATTSGGSSMQYFASGFTAKATISLSMWANASLIGNPPTDTETVTLTVNYDPTPGNKYTPIRYLLLSTSAIQYQAVKVVVDSVTVTGLSNGWTASNVLPLLTVENEMQLQRYFTLNDTVANLTPTITPNFDSVHHPDQLSVSWTFPPRAYNNLSQLEYAWVENETQGYYTVGGVFDTTLLFQQNSTRIDIDYNSNSYNIPLLFDADSTGILFYRVRAVEVSTGGNIIAGPWSSAKTFATQGHEFHLNWQATTDFAENEKSKSVVQYYDGSLRPRQTVTKDNSTGNTIVGQTIYDFQGRPNVQILPTPTNGTAIQFFKNFNKFVNEPGFTVNPAEYFDLSLPGQQGLPSPALDSTVTTSNGYTGAAAYYSAKNPWIDSERTANFIPDAAGYAYTETRYTDDPTQRVSVQGGVGPSHQIGNGHTTNYFYGQPSQNELDALFGTEAGNASHYFRNMVQDANGQISITYVDMHGRTVATALAGAAPTQMTGISGNTAFYPNQTGVTTTDSLLTRASNIVIGDSIQSTSTITVPTAEPYTFTYQLKPAIVQFANATHQSVCFDCKYNLEISLRMEGMADSTPIVYDFNNLQLVPSGQSCAVAEGFTGGGYTSPVTQISFTHTLAVGSWVVRKTLTINDSLFQLREDSALNSFLSQTQQSIADSVLNAMTTASQCSVPAATRNCTTCQTQLGTYSSFKASYLTSLPTNTTITDSAIHAIYSQDSLNCANACGTTLLPAMTTLGQLRALLLADMTPYSGQYALPLDSIARNTLLTAKYNIFTSTYTDSGSYGAYTGIKPYFRNPAVEPNGALGAYHDDANLPDPLIYPGGDSTNLTVLNTISPDSFATIFNTDWAEQLIVYHPEYKKLHFAETTLQHEFAYIDTVRQVTSQIVAADSGYLTPLTRDPYFTANGNTGVVAADRDSMNIRLYQRVNSRDTGGFSIWQLANGAVLIDTALPGALRNVMMAGLSKTGVSSAASTQAQKDAIWQNFNNIYLSYRNDMVMAYINAHESDTLKPAAMAELQKEGRTLHFVTDSGLAAQNAWTWYNLATGPGVDSVALADSAESYVAANTVDQCTAERQIWQSKLEQCEALQQYLMAKTNADTVLVDTIVNAILNGMVNVCHLSIDSSDPNGASNVSPSYPSADPANFEQIIDSVFEAYHIDTLPGTHQPYYFCNPYSVDYPKAYGKNPPQFATFSPTVDSCNCLQWHSLKATAASIGYDSTNMHSMNVYLEANYNDSLSLPLWTGLQLCSGRTKWDTSYLEDSTYTDIGDGDYQWVKQYYVVPQYIGLSADVEIPAFFSCGYVKPCVTCHLIDSLTIGFRTLFPNFAGVPYTDSTMDTTEMAQNALWARYLNYKTGFSLTANDYAAAFLNCGYDTALEGNLVLTDRTTQSPLGAGAPYSYEAKSTVSFENGYSSNTGDEFETNVGDSATGSTVAMCFLDPPVTYIPLPDTSVGNPCQSIQNQATYIGQLLFQQLQDSLTRNFDSIYRAKCLGAQSMEVFTATYQPSEYHYTLYYYDQAGNLVKTLPPAAVIPNYTPNYFIEVASARAANRDMTNGTNIESLATQYRYNTLNQVIAQQTPDGGTSYFWYDRLGRLAVSQNAKQTDSAAYSYTQYDALGRITEVGQKPQHTAMTQTISQDTTSLANWLADLTNGASKVQITRTVYDTAYVPMSGTSVPLNATNLRNRVAYTMVIDKDTTGVLPYRAATFYSYDPHGNVDTLLQDFDSTSVMGSVLGNRFKKMVYDYDLISGKVNQVSYQPGKADGFYHQYTYDAENRIVGVSTSRDSIQWENDASYTYYRHGPLARLELGSLGLQGVDYAYTLQGWLKSINPSWITPSGATNQEQYDSDGVSTTAYFERDAYKLNLNYFDDGTYTDFSPINPQSGYVQGNPLTSSAKRNLYNGNIASQAIDIRALTPNGSRDLGPMLYNYGYDALNRISSMDAWAANGKFQPGSSALSDYAERYTYDPNGNILTLNRTGDSVHPATAQLGYKYRYVNTSGGAGEYVPGAAPTTGVGHLTNQLSSIGVTSSGGAVNPNELTNQSSFNYQYNEIGQLTGENKAQVSNVVWNVYGKILSVSDSGNTITFTYDAAGNRISKTAHGITTWYVRDAQGNVISVYMQGNTAVHGDSLTQTEADVYGSSRLGLLNLSLNCVSLLLPDSGSLVRGNKLFELTNHLGNVLETVSDKKIQHSSDNSTVDYYLADVINANDSYSFGMLMPGRAYVAGSAGQYRYGFNGQEKTDEIASVGNHTTAEFWEYDPRSARRWNLDPKPSTGVSMYSTFGGNPVLNIDVKGDTLDIPWSQDEENHDASRQDILSILKPDHIKYVNIDVDGHVTFNKAMINEDGALARLQMDPGYELLRDLVTSKQTYLYSASGVSAERTIDLKSADHAVSRPMHASLYVTYPHGSTIDGITTPVSRTENGITMTMTDVNLAISNLSGTLKGTEKWEGFNQQIPGARQTYPPYNFYQGQVSIAQGEFYDKVNETKVTVPRAAMVFHELYENYLRTSEHMAYLPAHLGAVQAGKSLEFNNFGYRKYGEGSDYFHVK